MSASRRYTSILVILLAFAAWIFIGNGTRLRLQWPGIVLVGICGVIFALWFLRMGGWRRVQIPFQTFFAIGLFTYVTFRSYASPVTYLAQHDFFIAVCCLVIYLITTFFRRSEYQIKAIIAGLGIFACIQFGFGVVQFYFNEDFFPLSFLGLRRSLTDSLQASGSFNHGNHFAAFLELAGFLCLGVAVGSHRGIVRAISIISFAACVFGIAISTSRAAILALCVGGVSFLLVALILGKVTCRGGLIRWLSAKWAWLVGGVMLLGGGGFVAVTVTKEVHQQGFLGARGMRSDMWEMAIRQMSVSPSFGTGARSYEYYSRRYREGSWEWTGNTDKEPIFAHNDLLQYGAEYGVIGILLLLSVIVVHVGPLLRSTMTKKTGDLNWLAVGGCAALVAVATHSMLDFPLHIGVNALLASFALALMVRPVPYSVEPRCRSASNRPWGGMLAVGLCLVGAGVLTINGGKLAPAEMHAMRGDARFANRDYIGALGHYYNAEMANGENYLVSLKQGRTCELLAANEDLDYLSQLWTKRAIDSYRKVLSCYPQNLQAAIALSSILSRVGRIEEAEEVFITAFKWAPTFRNLTVAYAEHKLRVGDLAGAKLYYERALKLFWFGPQARNAKKIVDELEGALEHSGGN